MVNRTARQKVLSVFPQAAVERSLAGTSFAIVAKAGGLPYLSGWCRTEESAWRAAWRRLALLTWRFNRDGT